MDCMRYFNYQMMLRIGKKIGGTQLNAFIGLASDNRELAALEALVNKGHKREFTFLQAVHGTRSRVLPKTRKEYIDLIQNRLYYYKPGIEYAVVKRYARFLFGIQLFNTTTIL